MFYLKNTDFSIKEQMHVYSFVPFNSDVGDVFGCMFSRKLFHDCVSNPGLIAFSDSITHKNVKNEFRRKGDLRGGHTTP
jgi:hypothetical protein